VHHQRQAEDCHAICIVSQWAPFRSTRLLFGKWV
jgi:hypothetical protein